MKDLNNSLMELLDYWIREDIEYYFNLSFNTVANDFNENGFESACELIRRESIRAYRAEEASIGNI
jgi:hypothetical protein